jgi:hypothetical protein
MFFIRPILKSGQNASRIFVFDSSSFHPAAFVAAFMRLTIHATSFLNTDSHTAPFLNESYIPYILRVDGFINTHFAISDTVLFVSSSSSSGSIIHKLVSQSLIRYLLTK